MFKNLGPFLKWGLKSRLFYICCWAGPVGEQIFKALMVGKYLARRPVQVMPPRLQCEYYYNKFQVMGRIIQLVFLQLSGSIRHNSLMLHQHAT